MWQILLIATQDLITQSIFSLEDFGTFLFCDQNNDYFIGCSTPNDEDNLDASCNDDNDMHGDDCDGDDDNGGVFIYQIKLN